MKGGIWLLLAVSLLLFIPRVLSLSHDDKKELFLAHPLTQVRVYFTNSVTKRPVEIRFRPLFYFQGFEMLSDPETRAYYTFGTYEIAKRLSKERRSQLSFCSEEGIQIRISGRVYHVKSGCARVELLWPPVGFK